MDNRAIISALAAFLISAVLGRILIPFLRKLKLRQTERVEGVQEHLKKAGTPTMGGVIFLAAILVCSLVSAFYAPKICPVLLLTMGFGVIGFVDDYLKVVKHRSDGLYPRQKLLLQILVTGLFAVYILYGTDVGLSMRIPFTGGKMLDPGWIGIPLLFFAVIGTVNGVNFTDGIDGLASTVTVVVAIFFTVVSVMLGAGVELFSSVTEGALLGFLLYNAYPAKVFMGDTGSLALGGFVAGMAYMLQMPLFIPIVGLIYLVEVLSVILQVSYFKATHGKRIFKMSPIHHHFELSGWSETRVVAVFSIVTAAMCMIGLLAL